MVPTYPSYIQLRKYDLIAFSNNLFQYGIKKIRRIGHTMEFEQIKEYVQGDDLRTLYITSARAGRPQQECEALVPAGSLFSIEVGVPGLPVNFFRC